GSRRRQLADDVETQKVTADRFRNHITLVGEIFDENNRRPAGVDRCKIEKEIDFCMRWLAVEVMVKLREIDAVSPSQADARGELTDNCPQRIGNLPIKLVFRRIGEMIAVKIEDGGAVG